MKVVKALVLGMLLFHASAYTDGEKQKRIAILAMTPGGTPGEIIKGFRSIEIGAEIDEYVGIEINEESVRKEVREVLSKDYDLILSIGKWLSTTIRDELADREDKPPVIFAHIGFPVEYGLVDSLASSGNNFVGVEALPRLADITPFTNVIAQLNCISRVLIPFWYVPRIGEKNITQNNWLVQPLVQRLANAGQEVTILPIQDRKDISQIIEKKGREYDCLIIPTGDPLLSDLDEIATACKAASLFLCANGISAIEEGAAFGYCVPERPSGVRAAELAKKILFEGVAPSDIPTQELPGGRFFVVNKSAATEQGVDVSMLLDALKDAPVTFV